MVRGTTWIAWRRPIARLGCFGLFVRCLIGLYLTSLTVAAQAAVPVMRLESGGLVLELCTADGARTVVVDDAGRTSGRHDSDQHAGHDCTGCCVRCPPKALSGRTGVAVAGPMPWAGRVAGLREPPLRERFATRTPLPPRGPPILS